jgi:DNA-directed RNA polymerase subunit RPC12/RpoP
MKINCVSCGHKIELDNAYSDYEGWIRCFACGALLEIKTEEGGIRWVKVAHVGAAGGEHHSHEDSPHLESLVK